MLGLIICSKSLDTMDVNETLQLTKGHVHVSVSSNEEIKPVAFFICLAEGIS